MYSYTISREPNNKLFLQVCALIEAYVSEFKKSDLLIDVDGSSHQIYLLPQGKIEVCNDYEVYALYIDADINLENIVKQLIIAE